MTDREDIREDDLTVALHRLRVDVRRQLPVPASAAVRTAAIRQLRVRRTAIGVLAAAAVAVIALGTAAVLEPTAGPPVPPAATTTPDPAPILTPDPRPAPGPVPGLPDDPIVAVEWGEATIDIPAHERCPSGEISFVPVSDTFASWMGPATGFPRMYLDATRAAYGDLDGDGRAEAVLRATCGSSEEDSLDGEGQLLVISRDPDGALRAIGWVGPRGAIYQGAWIADGALYVEAHPWHGEVFEWAPGTALRYRWGGTGFSPPEAPPSYPAIVPTGEAGGAETGPPVRLAGVASGLGCPDGTVQFDHDGTAALGGATYDVLQPMVPSSGPHLLDLDNSGDPLLVLAIGCTRGGETTSGLAVFERGEDGFDGVSVLVPSQSLQVNSWQRERTDPDGRHVLLVMVELDGAIREELYRWNGTAFEPVS